MPLVGVAPPDPGSNPIVNVAAYGLVIVESGLIGVVLALYVRVSRAHPKSRHMRSLYVVLLQVAVMVSSWASVSRAVQFPRPIWAILTFVPIGAITVALALILKDQLTAKEWESEDRGLK